jgi:long-subunit acyl-CoA synthetase (AMP-forming)
MGILGCGCLAVGGVVTTINPSYGAEELAFQLQDTKARLIAVYPDLIDTVLESSRKFNLNMQILLMDPSSSEGYAHIPTLSSVLDKVVVSTEERRAWRKPIVPGQDLAFLIYSSGTTGRPKGVMLTHRNIVANILQISSVEGPNLSWKTDKVLGFLPLYHIYGKFAIFLGIISLAPSNRPSSRILSHGQG